MTRKEIQRRFSGLFAHIKKNNPELLDKYIPSKRPSGRHEERLKEIEAFCKKHGKFPTQKFTIKDEKKLLNWANAMRYNTEYNDKIKTLRNKYGRCSKNIKKNNDFANLLPSYITYNGTIKNWGKPYKFKDLDYGIFTANPINIMKTLLKGGITGHPDRPKTIIHTRKSIVNIDTGEMFLSLAEAKSTYKGAISKALKNPNILAGGYRWAYCDEKGNIIE